MTPENTENAIRLLYEASKFTGMGMKATLEIAKAQHDQIQQLQQRIEQLEDNVRYEQEKRHQDQLNELDRQDGEWYRKVHDLG